MRNKKRLLGAPLALLFVLSGQSGIAADPEVIQELWEGRLYAKAMEILSPALNDASASADDVTMLGIAYEEGLGVESDLGTALSLYRRGATGGSSEAAYRLGRMYENGHGVKQDDEAAFNWYLKGAGEDPRAAFKYASAVLANEGLRAQEGEYDPVDRMRFAAESGVDEAALVLGSLYQDGIERERNIAQAVKWLSAVSDESDASAEAERRLGLAFSDSDKSRAIGHFMKAFEKGDGIAAAYLGYYADRAARTEAQRRVALDYYRKSKEANIDWATRELERLEEHFRSVELLGMKMYGVRKTDIRSQLDKIGMPLLAESPGFWDAYDSTKVLPGSRSLTIAYAPGEEQVVAELAYRFEPDGLKRERLNFARLRQKLSEKYGQYENMKSGQSVGAIWNVGKTNILLKRLDRTKGLILVYRFEPYATHLAEVYAQAQKQAVENGDAMPEAL